jgi:NAD(P)-dependent dehydrogenase (short-subunit alcohol dehydrogenase family)/acyl carrier protein
MQAAIVPEVIPAVVAPNGNGLNAEILAGVLLSVVSEKTGYPAEMLELSMDMEADLGIDSIKRVEILGAIRTQFTELPPFKAEDLAELRTLQQIVDYMRIQVSPAAPEVQPQSFFKVELGQHDIPRGVVGLKYLPRPDFWDFELLNGAVCLLTDDGTPLTAALAQELEARGWQVVVLSYPASLFPSSEVLPPQTRRIMLPDMSEEQLQAAVDTISTHYGPIQAFIHLNPAYQRFTRNGNLFLTQEKTIIKHVFLMAKYLKPALTQAHRSSFMTVVWLGGTLGVYPQEQYGAIAGGLLGLTKTLNLEWESVCCRAVDLSSKILTVEAARHIVAELYDPNRLVVEVAYGSAGRVTLVTQAG